MSAAGEQHLDIAVGGAVNRTDESQRGDRLVKLRVDHPAKRRQDVFPAAHPDSTSCASSLAAGVPSSAGSWSSRGTSMPYGFAALSPRILRFVASVTGVVRVSDIVGIVPIEEALALPPRLPDRVVRAVQRRDEFGEPDLSGRPRPDLLRDLSSHPGLHVHGLESAGDDRSRRTSPEPRRSSRSSRTATPHPFPNPCAGRIRAVGRRDVRRYSEALTTNEEPIGESFGSQIDETATR